MESLVGGAQVGSGHGSWFIQLVSDYWRISTALLAIVVSIVAFVGAVKWRLYVVAGVFVAAAIIVLVLYVDPKAVGLGGGEGKAETQLADAEYNVRVKLRQSGLNDHDIRLAEATLRLQQAGVSFEGRNVEVTRGGIVKLKFESENVELEPGIAMSVTADGQTYGTATVTWRTGTSYQIEFPLKSTGSGSPEPDSVKTWSLRPEFDSSKADPVCYVPLIQVLVQLKAPERDDQKERIK